MQIIKFHRDNQTKNRKNLACDCSDNIQFQWLINNKRILQHNNNFNYTSVYLYLFLIAKVFFCHTCNNNNNNNNNICDKKTNFTVFENKIGNYLDRNIFRKTFK